ncbi:WD40 repeat-like family [Trichomonas vaginalis G3]|uniref:WD40 repeat-like family n=1 Tax=Trichomonas vaginalis (strain ATCC PRA-98 / G3) TaxID=412133 RepID=UPI0021E5C00E|nr:WD40 repeat-like family [Trichomonas vaginalis G3]KAI5510459.1 WD40 repeat-like family [Trichomonas vaginalis G3]
MTENTSDPLTTLTQELIKINLIDLNTIPPENAKNYFEYCCLNLSHYLEYLSNSNIHTFYQLDILTEAIISIFDLNTKFNTQLKQVIKEYLTKLINLDFKYGNEPPKYQRGNEKTKQMSRLQIYSELIDKKLKLPETKLSEILQYTIFQLNTEYKIISDLRLEIGTPEQNTPDNYNDTIISVNLDNLVPYLFVDFAINLTNPNISRQKTADDEFLDTMLQTEYNSLNEIASKLFLFKGSKIPINIKEKFTEKILLMMFVKPFTVLIFNSSDEMSDDKLIYYIYSDMTCGTEFLNKYMAKSVTNTMNQMKKYDVDPVFYIFSKKEKISKEEAKILLQNPDLIKYLNKNYEDHQLLLNCLQKTTQFKFEFSKFGISTLFTGVISNNNLIEKYLGILTNKLQIYTLNLLKNNGILNILCELGIKSDKNLPEIQIIKEKEEIFGEISELQYILTYVDFLVSQKSDIQNIDTFLPLFSHYLVPKEIKEKFFKKFESNLPRLLQHQMNLIALVLNESLSPFETVKNYLTNVTFYSKNDNFKINQFLTIINNLNEKDSYEYILLIENFKDIFKVLPKEKQIFVLKLLSKFDNPKIISDLTFDIDWKIISEIAGSICLSKPQTASILLEKIYSKMTTFDLFLSSIPEQCDEIDQNFFVLFNDLLEKCQSKYNAINYFRNPPKIENIWPEDLPKNINNKNIKKSDQKVTSQKVTKSQKIPNNQQNLSDQNNEDSLDQLLDLIQDSFVTEVLANHNDKESEKVTHNQQNLNGQNNENNENFVDQNNERNEKVTDQKVTNSNDEENNDNLWVDNREITRCRNKKTKQKMFQCFTCKDNPIVCLNCASVCHKNHDLVYIGEENTKCQCSTKSSCSFKEKQKQTDLISISPEIAFQTFIKLSKIFKDNFDLKPYDSIPFTFIPVQPTTFIGDNAIILTDLRQVDESFDNTKRKLEYTKMNMAMTYCSEQFILFAIGRTIKVVNSDMSKILSSVKLEKVILHMSKNENEDFILVTSLYNAYILSVSNFGTIKFENEIDNDDIIYDSGFLDNTFCYFVCAERIKIYNTKTKKLIRITHDHSGDFLSLTCFDENIFVTFRDGKMFTMKISDLSENVTVKPNMKTQLKRFSCLDVYDNLVFVNSSSNMIIYEKNKFVNDSNEFLYEFNTKFEGMLRFLLYFNGYYMFVHTKTNALFGMKLENRNIRFLQFTKVNTTNFPLLEGKLSLVGTFKMKDKVYSLSNLGYIHDFSPNIYYLKTSNEKLEKLNNVENIVPPSFWTKLTLQNKNCEVKNQDGNKINEVLHGERFIFRPGEKEKTATIKLTNCPDEVICGFVISLGSNSLKYLPSYISCNGEILRPDSKRKYNFPLLPSNVSKEVTLSFVNNDQCESNFDGIEVYTCKVSDIKLESKWRDSDDLMNFNFDGFDRFNAVERFASKLAMTIDFEKLNVSDDQFSEVVKLIYTNRYFSQSSRYICTRIQVEDKREKWPKTAVSCFNEIPRILSGDFWRDFNLNDHNSEIKLPDSIEDKITEDSLISAFMMN